MHIFKFVENINIIDRCDMFSLSINDGGLRECNINIKVIDS